MGRRMNPGCLLRSTLAVCGIVFLPFSVWFLRSWIQSSANWRQGLQGIALIAVSIVFLRLAFTRKDNSWISAIDDL
jgi:hypothetical protein